MASHSSTRAWRVLAASNAVSELRIAAVGPATSIVFGGLLALSLGLEAAGDHPAPGSRRSLARRHHIILAVFNVLR
jgi:hypothetical protein